MLVFISTLIKVLTEEPHAFQHEASSKLASSVLLLLLLLRECGSVCRLVCQLPWWRFAGLGLPYARISAKL